MDLISWMFSLACWEMAHRLFTPHYPLSTQEHVTTHTQPLAVLVAQKNTHISANNDKKAMKLPMI